MTETVTTTYIKKWSVSLIVREMSTEIPFLTCQVGKDANF